MKKKTISNTAATVSVTMIKILRAYARRFKIDPDTAMASAGIDPVSLEKSEARVPAATFQAVWQHIAGAAGDPNPGLNFGRELSRQYPAGSVLFTMMLNCPDMGSALKVFVRYHRVMAEVIHPVMDVTGNSVSLSWQVSFPDIPDSPDLAEALLCIFHTVIQTLSQGRITPGQVCFTRGQPDDISPYREQFNTTLVFSAPKNELTLRSQDLDMKIDLANPALYAVLEKHAARILACLGREKKWSDNVLSLLGKMVVSDARLNIETVADRLGVSIRSLQEKLKKEGTTFRNLLEEVRRQVAQDFLRDTNTDICDIAFLLGYAEQSAFNRAFKRWTGMTPRTFRNHDRPDTGHTS